MIAGLLLRNFKSYKGVNFIPFLKDDFEYLNIFIGNNGAGKSSILEALNSCFNDGKWIPTTSQTDVYVAPIFLLAKDKYSNLLTSETKETIEKLSSFYWGFVNNGSAIYDTVKDFIEFKDSIKSKYEQTHYFLLLGKHYTDKKNIYFATFQPEIINMLGYSLNKDNELNKANQKTVNKVFQELNELMTFIYVPAETNISQFLKLDSEEMQDLVNKNIKDVIDGILNKNYILEGTATSKKIVDLINEQLSEHIDKIQATIGSISDYKFNTGRTTKLNSRDLIAPIIRAFYSKRSLEKNSKPIDDWSTGERKKALIAIVYSFLSQEGIEMEKEIIFAIDEPESSLDTANKYDSFNLIEKISNNYDHQTFITTHWYGFLPIIQKGLIHCLEAPSTDEKKSVEIKKYDAKTFIADRRKETDDNYFKSFSDLASSIVSSIRTKNLNWIIVEGADDRNYVDYYLRNLIEGYKDKFRVLSIGGKGEVKLLYEHLFIPIKNIENTNPERILGKVLCLVDTDEQVLKLKTEFQPKNLKNLFFKRLQNIDGVIKLLHISEENYTQRTVIEDTLESNKFYESLKIVVGKCNDTNIKRAFNNFKFYERAKNSRIDGDGSILTGDPKEQTDIEQDKLLIKNFVNDSLETKWNISCAYCQQPFQDNEVPLWIREFLLKCFYESERIPYINKSVENIAPIASPGILATNGQP